MNHLEKVERDEYGKVLQALLDEGFLGEISLTIYATGEETVQVIRAYGDNLIFGEADSKYLRDLLDRHALEAFTFDFQVEPDRGVLTFYKAIQENEPQLTTISTYPQEQE